MSFKAIVDDGHPNITIACIKTKLEDLTVLKRSPDIFNKVKIGQDQLQLIMKHILFMGVAAILVK